MINIIFDESVGSFFFTCKEEEDMTLEEELLVITQKIFALYAANMPGDTVEVFKKMAGYITNVYDDPDCRSVLEEIYEVNTDTIFLNDESVDEAIGFLLKSILGELDEIEDESDRALVELIAETYCKSLGIDIETLKKVENNDDNEDDLF
jgi:hypothetical protein